MSNPPEKMQLNGAGAPAQQAPPGYAPRQQQHRPAPPGVARGYAAAGAPGYGPPQQGYAVAPPPPKYAPVQQGYAQAPQQGYAQAPQQGYYAPAPEQQPHYPQQGGYPGGYGHGMGVFPPGFNHTAGAGAGAGVAVGVPPMQAPQEWTTGLFDMGDDLQNCVITFFCPCITFGQVAEIVDQGTTSCILAGSVWMGVLMFFGCPCFISCLWREKLRAKYNLPTGECGDFCLHFWCESCALCQEYRELKNRGLNPSLGWEYHRQAMYAQAMQQQQPMGTPQQAHMQR